jgi:hypothetical protein
MDFGHFNFGSNKESRKWYRDAILNKYFEIKTYCLIKITSGRKFQLMLDMYYPIDVDFYVAVCNAIIESEKAGVRSLFILSVSQSIPVLYSAHSRKRSNIEKKIFPRGSDRQP